MTSPSDPLVTSALIDVPLVVDVPEQTWDEAARVYVPVFAIEAMTELPPVRLMPKIAVTLEAPIVDSMCQFMRVRVEWVDRPAGAALHVLDIRAGGTGSLEPQDRPLWFEADGTVDLAGRPILIPPNRSYVTVCLLGTSEPAQVRVFAQVSALRPFNSYEATPRSVSPAAS